MTTQSILDFTAETTERAPGRILPQKAGSALWGPMFIMALMGFAAGFILAIVKANKVATGADPDQIQALVHYGTGAMFFGFASVFAAISFAIAKILGEFRVGGGSVQEAVGSDVKTLKMPVTAKAFIAIMAMAMMLIFAAVVLHVAAGVAIAAGGVTATAAEQWFIWIEAARRIGVILYLFAIMLGLVTIARVIRFQTFRIRQVAEQS